MFELNSKLWLRSQISQFFMLSAALHCSLPIKRFLCHYIFWVITKCAHCSKEEQCLHFEWYLQWSHSLTKKFFVFCYCLFFYLTKGSKNLTNLQQQLKSAQECKVLLSADKQKLTSVINAIKDQRKLDKDKLQRALIKTNELKEQLAEEKTMAVSGVFLVIYRGWEEG